MKFYYQCDICKTSFNNFDECQKHEKECSDEHRKGIDFAYAINCLLEEIKKEDIKIRASNGFYDNARYDAIMKEIVIGEGKE